MQCVFLNDNRNNSTFFFLHELHSDILASNTIDGHAGISVVQVLLSHLFNEGRPYGSTLLRRCRVALLKPGWQRRFQLLHILVKLCENLFCKSGWVRTMTPQWGNATQWESCKGESQRWLTVARPSAAESYSPRCSCTRAPVLTSQSQRGRRRHRSDCETGLWR